MPSLNAILPPSGSEGCCVRGGWRRRRWAYVALALLGASSAGCGGASSTRNIAARQRSDATSPGDAKGKPKPHKLGGDSTGSAGAPRPSNAGPGELRTEVGVSASDASSGQFEDLDVTDFPPGVLWVPRGNERRPLLVAAHGAGGQPQTHCSRWQALVRERAFVLCVRGAKTNRSDPLAVSHHYYPDHLWLGRAVDASVAALVARYPRVDADAAVYAGYSQGAVMGALMLMSRAQRFPRALLIEGQQNDWNVAGASRWKTAGGLRVGLVCGLERCAQSQEHSRQSLRRGGVDVALRYARGAGHTYAGAVAPLVAELLEWLVADDPRWQRRTD